MEEELIIDFIVTSPFFKCLGGTQGVSCPLPSVLRNTFADSAVTLVKPKPLLGGVVSSPTRYTPENREACLCVVVLVLGFFEGS